MFRWIRSLVRAIRSYEDLAKRVKLVERDNLLLRSQLKTCMGIDQSWYDWGKIIIMMHLKTGDVVKILDVKRQISLPEYHELCRHLEARYGTPPKYVDTPDISRKDWLRLYGGRW